MEIILAIFVGILYAAGVYLLLRRSILKFIIGILFFSNATNLLVFLSAGLIPGGTAFVEEQSANTTAMTDPLPQALVLTAVVIGLGVVAFTLALKYKYFEISGTDDLDEMKQVKSETNLKEEK